MREGCLRISYMLYIWMRLPREVYNPPKKVGGATNLKPMETCVELTGVGSIHQGRFDGGPEEVQLILVAWQVGKPNGIHFVTYCPRLMVAGYDIYC